MNSFGKVSTRASVAAAMSLVVVGVFVGVAVYGMRRVSSIDYVRTMGGEVKVEAAPSWVPEWIPVPEWARSVDAVDCRGCPRVDLRRIAICGEIKHLTVARAALVDPSLDGIDKLSGIESLDISMTGANDAGLLRLQSCKKLRVLWAQSLPVTDEGVRGLRGLPLACVALSKAHITDVGLATFARMPLEVVYIGGTGVSDVGLEALHASPIKRIDVGGTAVTVGGIKGLQRATGLKHVGVSGRLMQEVAELDRVGLVVFRSTVVD